MKTEELIQSYQAIYNMLDGLTVRGISDCAAVAGCGAHIKGQLEKLEAQLQAERKAEQKAAMAAAMKAAEAEENKV